MKKEIWTSASSWGVTGAAYERFSEHFADALFHCAQRLAPRPGESLLDVATGTGWTARIAAARGAHVTGIDYSEEMIVAARKIAQHCGVTITFDVGDAHQLPYPDNSFDAIIRHLVSYSRVSLKLSHENWLEFAAQVGVSHLLCGRAIALLVLWLAKCSQYTAPTNRPSTSISLYMG